MITKTIYKCEICGQDYDVEQLARKCETSHVNAEFITNQSFPKTEQYPDEIIITMANGHKLIYKYYKPVFKEPSDEPYFTNITVSRDVETNQVIMTALGERLPEHEDYTWVILCDETRITATSTTPTVILSSAASHIFDIADLVRVNVSATTVPSGQFVVKDDF